MKFYMGMGDSREELEKLETITLQQILKQGGTKMGQYFDCVMGSATTKFRKYPAHDFGQGAKITEHSWVGNDFVNKMAHILRFTPRQVAWIGDYAEDVEPKFDNVAEFKYNGVKKLPVDYMENGILANYRKKEYLDMSLYYELNKYDDARDTWCLNPLPLLTAVGNGQGGGDYHGINEDDVGIWAYDTLRFAKPSDYENWNLITSSFTPVMYEFREE